MNTKLFLLIGTSLSFIPSLTFAQCVATQDCATLGYTETSCNGGKGIKCPFGNKWACIQSDSEIEQQFCDKYGYKYTCSGTGYSGGGGEKCNNKYSYCNCTSPYTWSNGACTCDSIYQYTCSGTGYAGGGGKKCNNKYSYCNCTSPYTWTSGACSCPSTYKYTCSGTGYSGGGSEKCNNKYSYCNCTSPYTWSGSACTCDSIYQYTCSGTGYSGGSGTACGGKYAACTCSSPYSWSGSACTCPSTYLYTCSGTGYSGGSGTACGGKYVACTCAPGYEWKDGSCQKQVLNGAQGELYYCNDTVVGVRAPGMDFYVAMQDLGTMTWSNANSQCASYVFCGNVKGTLPTKAQLVTIYNNKSSINSLLSTNGGTQLANNYYWSSTISGNPYYIVDMSNGDVYGGNGYYSHGNDTYVLPVLTSW